MRGAVADLAGRIADGGRVGRLLPEGSFEQLAQSFSLEEDDLDLLVVAAAPELDPRLATALDGRVTVGRALELVGADPWDGVARARLTPAGPLVRHGLVHVDDADQPFPIRHLRVPDRVVRHLLGDDSPDVDIAPLLTSLVPADVRGAADLARAIASSSWLAWIRERPGTSGRSLAAAALRELEVPAIAVDLGRLPEGQGLAHVLRAALREATLLGGALVVGPVVPARDRAALASIGDLPCPLVLIGADAWQSSWCSSLPFTLDALAVDAEARAVVWGSMVEALGADADPAAISALRLSPEQIVVASAAAATQAAAQGRDVTDRDLLAGVRSQNAGRLDGLARRIEPDAGFDDLVLQQGHLEELRGIVDRVRTAGVVRDQWKMGGGGAGRGTGVTCLFAGPSGVGKTLSAEVLAHELGVDLYTIDLSQVVDKYIGETEKNLERIFVEAEGVNGVLFFDEADAIFGKRSDVKSSNDRHANVEVAYLLQRMERFDGVAVLATNLRGNLDVAFTRRLDVIIQFQEPDEDDRVRLWELHLPPTLPQADDIDVPFLAKAIVLTGGIIRNITLSAAHVAAAGSRPVEMMDLVHSLRRECRKVGRLVPPGALAPYIGEEDDVPSPVEVRA